MKFIGSRTIKTAVAVFLTAFICQAIGWPPVFAVITAIVTLEPTVSDSIKKGIIRFPASAIGSFYAVLFIALFGNSPIAYTFAATLTILSCYRLNLHAGLLVATITSVAMIEVVHDHYLQSFLIRLGTTTVGIVVSTLVNLFILPRNFKAEIIQNITTIKEKIREILERILDDETKELKEALNQVSKKIDDTDQLIQYQIEETRYDLPMMSKRKDVTSLQSKTKHLQILLYHTNNLTPIQLEQTSLQVEEMQFIRNVMKELATFLVNDESSFPNAYEKKLRKLLGERQIESEQQLLSHEFILLYELISIFYIVKQLNDDRQHSN